MHDSKLPLQKWAFAFYLYSTNLKGVSSMKLHRDLDITQKTAWYLAIGSGRPGTMRLSVWLARGSRRDLPGRQGRQ